jgi:hypothetical protein
MVVAQPGLRRKLAAILMTDVGEYRLLMIVDEATRVCALDAIAIPTAVDAQSILCARGGKRHQAWGERV